MNLQKIYKLALMLLLVNFLPNMLKAQCSEPGSYNYETISDGAWSSASTWLGGNIPNSNLVKEKNILITHNVDNSTASVSTTEESRLTIKDGGSLTVNSFTLSKDSYLDINFGKLIVTTGDFRVKADSRFCAYEACFYVESTIQFDKDAKNISITNSGLKAGSDITMKSKHGVSGDNIKLYAGNNITISHEGKWAASTISAWYAGGGPATGFTGTLPAMSGSSFEVCAPNSDLKVEKTVNNSSAPVGSTVIFTVTASNVFGVSEPNAKVQDLLPSGFTYISSTVTAGSYNSGTGLWTIGILNVAQSETMTITATFNSAATNMATITGDVIDSDESNNTASAAVNVPGASYCVTGCNDNTFLNAVDPNTIEYDNIVGLYHSTMMKSANQKVFVWGQNSFPNGSSNSLSPFEVSPANGYNYTGSILKFTGAEYGQFAVLTTTGLYMWGGTSKLVSSSIKGTSQFGPVTINGQTNGLPAGVVPSDVKMLFGSYKTLAITTCTGDAWILSNTGNKNGDNTSEDHVWHRIKTDAATFLTNVVAMRGTQNAMMALTANGTVYTWGNAAYLGNNTGPANKDYATQMSLPAGVTVKMIGMTASQNVNSYYILSTTGSLYSLGNNSTRQLGDFTTSERREWVKVHKPASVVGGSTDSGTFMDDIAWISPQEHDYRYGGVSALSSDGKLYSWGGNSFKMLGTSPNPANPTYMPGGLNAGDKLLAVETGGHTSIVFRQCSLKFGYVGHRIDGSMGDGTSTNAQEDSYNFTNTPAFNLCGAPTAPTVQDLTICPDATANLADALLGIPFAGTHVEWQTTSTYAPGTQISDPTTVGLGTYYAFYVGGPNACPEPVPSEPVVVSTEAAPIVIQDLKVCAGSTADLADAVTGTPPTGTTIAWYTTSTMDEGTEVPDPSAVVAGTYYAFYVDGECENPLASDAVEVSYYAPGEGGCPLTLLIQGTVFNDANGLLGTPANTVDGDGTNIGDQLYAHLVDADGTTVLQTVEVEADGTYAFVPVVAGTYSIVLNTSSTADAIPSLPAGWVNTGENIGTGAGNDGIVNGILELGAITGPVLNGNFGIEELPTVGNGVTNNVLNPGGTSQVIVPPTTFNNVNPSSDPSPGEVTGIRITAFPTGATSIVIGGVTYNAGVPADEAALIALIIPTDANGAPTQEITVDPTDDGVTSVDISFVAVDAAGMEGSNTDDGAGHAIINFTVVPDLTPRITVNPNNFIGIKTLEITVQINELLNVNTDGSLITLFLDKNADFSNFSFDAGQTLNNNDESVQNSLFNIDAISNPDYYVITTNVVFKNSNKRVAFKVDFNPKDAIGESPVNVFLKNGSGGENKFSNNSDFTSITFSF